MTGTGPGVWTPLGVGEYFTMAGFAARTETPGLSGRDYAYNVDSEYNNGTHRAHFEYGRTGEDFNPRSDSSRTRTATVASTAAIT